MEKLLTEVDNVKVLIATDLFTTVENGVVTSVRNLREELEKKGHEVRILTLSDNHKSYKEGNVYYIRSIPFPIYPEVRLSMVLSHKYIRELADWGPDVIHTQCEFFSFRYARKLAKKTGAHIVHTYHTLYEQYVSYLIPNKRIGYKIVRSVTRSKLRKVRTVIAPTKKVERALRGYGVDTDIRVIPSGIRLEQHRVRISPSEREHKRKELGISDEMTVFINLGRLGTEKNLGEIVDCFAKLLKRREDVFLLIVGDGPAKAELEKQACSLGIKERVIFTGKVPPTEVQKYYQLGDVFVSASTSETQGLTYIESAANGLPLLCRKDPCLEDVIRCGENGYEYTNEDEFIEYGCTMADSKDWRLSAGRVSEMIADSFDKSRFGDAVESVYISVCDLSASTNGHN